MVYLKRYGTITSLKAFDHFKITRLGDVIFKLRKKGVKINTELRWSGKTSYAVYSLQKSA